LKKQPWVCGKPPDKRKELDNMTQETGIVTTNNAFEELANFNLTDAMSQELEGLSLSFERIKIPSAGSTVFELPAVDGGEPETVKEFTGVILYHHPLFAYYRDKYAGGNEPPDCGSFDGVTGEGDPGGACAKCRITSLARVRVAVKRVRTAVASTFCARAKCSRFCFRCDRLA
jgi:hypothetical protein